MSANYCELVDKEIERILKESDDYIKEYIDPIANVPSPEKIVGHPYPFSMLELEALRRVYVYNQKPLNDYIAKRAISELHALEEEVESMEV